MGQNHHMTAKPLLFLVVLFTSNALGMFIEHETERVPVDRALETIHVKLASSPDDFELHYQVARLHAIKAFTPTETVSLLIKNEGDNRAGLATYAGDGVGTGTPESARQRKARSSTNLQANEESNRNLRLALSHYETSLGLLRKKTNATNATRLIQAIELGYAWCLDMSGKKDLAISAYRKALATSWQIEVTKDFKIEEWSKGSGKMRKTFTPPAEGRSALPGAGVCFSGECTSYLLGLLNPKIDADEISALKTQKAFLDEMPRAITPILIPMENTGIENLVNPKAGVPFDLDGSGYIRNWGWITPKAAWLVFDNNRTGRITSGLQLFGSVTFWVFWRDGYQALGSLDINQDGKLDGDELNGLCLWRDLNENGVSDDGEVKPVSTFGIVSISCQSSLLAEGLRWSHNGVRFKDGSVRPSYDWDSPLNLPEASK